VWADRYEVLGSRPDVKYVLFSKMKCELDAAADPG
jgi:hypothetical protein